MLKRFNTQLISVDYDYFINSSHSDRLNKFPNYEEDCSALALSGKWADAYGKYPELKNTVLTQNYMDISRMLQVPFETMHQIEIGTDHNEIFNFIRFLADGLCTVDILHIDHHSDLDAMYANERLTCANWALKTLNHFDNVNITWLGNADSDPIGLAGDSGEYFKQCILTDNIEEIKAVIADYAEAEYGFMCLSPQFVPKHLHDEFGKFTRFMEGRRKI